MSINENAPKRAYDNLSIVDWLRNIEHPDGLMEPDLLSSTIARILGKESLEGCRIPTAPADELARLLADIGKNTPPGTDSARTLRRALELCFLNTPTYKAALSLYRMEIEGEVYGGAYVKGIPPKADSLWEVVTGILNYVPARAGAEPEPQPRPVSPALLKVMELAIRTDTPDEVIEAMFEAASQKLKGKADGQ